MKFLPEIILVAVLIVVLYQSPTFLQMHLNTVLGKLLLISIVAYIALNHGLNAGLLSSFIVIVLLNGAVEGVDETLEDDEKKEDEKGDDENEEGNDAAPVDDEGEGNDTEEEEGEGDAEEEDDTEEEEEEEDIEEEGDAEDAEEPEKEGYSNINRPLQMSMINLVDQDRMFKVNALKNNQRSRKVSNSVINDMKGLLNRVSRLELLQEDLENEIMQPDNLENY